MNPLDIQYGISLGFTINFWNTHLTSIKLDAYASANLEKIVASEPCTIEDHIPKNLDEIIRLRRDSFSLRISSPEEIASLPATIEGDDTAIQATIDNWYLICLAYSKAVDMAPQLTHFLLGINREADCAWMTSAANAIDRERSVVRTSNSLYGLGSKGAGHPDLNLILHVCHTLHKWGIGKQLGVLEIFY